MFDYQGPQTEVCATGGGFTYEIRDFPRRSPPGDDAVVRRGTFDRTVVYSFRRDSKLSLPHFCDLHSRRRTCRGGARDRELGAEPERGHGCQWRNLHNARWDVLADAGLQCRLSGRDDFWLAPARLDSQGDGGTHSPGWLGCADPDSDDCVWTY